jgi:hypothetical protein
MSSYAVPQPLNISAIINIQSASIVETSPTQIVFNDTIPIPANSGGDILSSGVIVSVNIKAQAQNTSDIYVGGPPNPPYSGKGYRLEPGESVQLDVANLNGVRLVAVISGDFVTFYATL